MWDPDDIEETEKRLKSIRDEIHLSILVSIRKKISQFPNDENARMLGTLEEIAGQQAESREDSRHLIEMLITTEKASKGRHEELLEQNNRLLNTINAMAVSGSTSPVSAHFVAKLEDEKRREAAERAVLSCLWYASMRDREESISEAHATTFQWVFEDPKAMGRPWDNLAEFLRSNELSFWITGKPGSGKSTLMKFICQSARTQSLLQEWAGDKDLIMTSFYFFYNGDKEQKSELGLVRSLLHSILGGRRDLIPIAFRERFEAAYEGRTQYNEPSLPEVKRALKNLISHKMNFKFFISIDGLDEFDPEISHTSVQSLIDFTHFLKKYENIKTLLSSRPLSEFEHGYSGYPTLRIHDLTKDDIHRYSMDKLMQHPRMQVLTSKKPNRMNEMLQSIVEASSGVFLWVRLVTESLLSGLTNHDRVEDLQKRLEELPSDLHDLYSTLLSRVDIDYRPRTAQLIGLLLTVVRQPSLLDLWFAMEADNDMVRHTPVTPISDDEVSERVQEMEGRVKSLSRGLIEVVPCDNISESDIRSLKLDYAYQTLIYDLSTDQRRATARFIHRSVYEFLARGGGGKKFVGGYLPRTFCTSLAVLRSGILVIKTCGLSGGASWASVMRLAHMTGHRARAAGGDPRLEADPQYLDLVDELDRAVQEIMPLVYHSAELMMGVEAYHDNPKEAELFASQALNVIPDRASHWSAWIRYLNLLNIDAPRRRVLWPLQDKGEASMMTFAAAFKLIAYIKNKIKTGGQEVLKPGGCPLLLAHLPYLTISWPVGVAPVVKMLLEQNNSPNEVYKGVSVWQWYLWTFRPGPRLWDFEHLENTYYHLVRFIAITEVMISAGADPNAYIVYHSVKDNTLDYETGFKWSPHLLGRHPTVCTILLALSRLNVKQAASKDSGFLRNEIEELDQRIQAVIKMLRERGAVEKEWKGWDSIEPLIREVNEKLELHESGAKAEEATEKDAGAPAGPVANSPDDSTTTTTEMLTGEDEDVPVEELETPRVGGELTGAKEEREKGRSSTKGVTVKNEDVKHVNTTTSDAVESTAPSTVTTKKSRLRRWYRKLSRTIKRAV